MRAGRTGHCVWRRYDANCPAFRPSGAEAFHPRSSSAVGSSTVPTTKNHNSALQQGRDGPCVV